MINIPMGEIILLIKICFDGEYNIWKYDVVKHM